MASRCLDLLQRRVLLGRVDQHFQEGTNSRVGASTFGPNHSDIVSVDSKLRQNRGQLRALDPGGRGKTRAYSNPRACRNCCHNAFACIDNDTG